MRRWEELHWDFFLFFTLYLLGFGFLSLFVTLRSFVRSVSLHPLRFASQLSIPLFLHHLLHSLTFHSGMASSTPRHQRSTVRSGWSRSASFDPKRVSLKSDNQLGDFPQLSTISPAVFLTNYLEFSQQQTSNLVYIHVEKQRPSLSSSRLRLS